MSDVVAVRESNPVPEYDTYELQYNQYA